MYNKVNEQQKNKTRIYIGGIDDSYSYHWCSGGNSHTQFPPITRAGETEQVFRVFGAS
jgi:hypothetical protein